ncbi:Phage Tail Collar Domain [Leminorella grimontii]|nr:phage tail protein [Leminorella grimontii]VFS62683.1 Phage Tail Collar Domain [Leminorella grimontii]
MITIPASAQCRPVGEVSNATPKWFTESPPSYPGAAWFNIVQAELLNLLDAAGISPQKADLTQLTQAVNSLVFGAIPVGVPLPYPSATPPDGFLKCNGAPFDKTLYPKLAVAYPSGVLPDLRGEFLRGWDDGRGVDAGRELLSAQGDAIRNISGLINEIMPMSPVATMRIGNISGAFKPYVTAARNILDGIGFQASQPNQITGFFLDASIQVPVADENRPRSVAFNYIVRAA